MSGKLVVYAAHGWGFDHSFWAPLKQILEKQSWVKSFIAKDSGYFSKAVHLDFPKDPFIVLGHSLGSLEVLSADIPSHCKGIFILNGFYQYVKSDEFQEGVDTRIVERMKGLLRSRPETVLADFYKNCGGEVTLSKSYNVERLSEGLDRLLSLKAHESFKHIVSNGKLLGIIEASDDQIAPYALSKDLALVKPVRDIPVLIMQGGHLSVSSHVKECADFISKVVQIS